jgi:hypothetical protein
VDHVAAARHVGSGSNARWAYAVTTGRLTVAAPYSLELEESKRVASLVDHVAAARHVGSGSNAMEAAPTPDRSFTPRCSRCEEPLPREEIRGLQNSGTGVTRPIHCRNRECGARMGEVERLFYQLDTSGDGKLGHKELRALSHRLFSYEDGNAVADPADIDGAQAELAEALDAHNCDWDTERLGLGLVCTPRDFMPSGSGGRVLTKAQAQTIVERLLRAKETDKSFAGKLRDADTDFRGMLSEINAADSSAVTRAEFSRWWKQLGSEVQHQQREQQREQQQHSGELAESEYELEVRLASSAGRCLYAVVRILYPEPACCRQIRTMIMLMSMRRWCP